MTQKETIAYYSTVYASLITIQKHGTLYTITLKTGGTTPKMSGTRTLGWLQGFNARPVAER